MTKRRGRGHGTKRKNKRTMRRRHSHSAHLTRNRSRRHRHRHGSRVRRGGMLAAAAEVAWAKKAAELGKVLKKKGDEYYETSKAMSNRKPPGIVKEVPKFSYHAASAASGRQLPSGAPGVSKAPAPYSRKPISVTNLVTPPSLTVPPSNRHFAAARAASASDAAPSARADAGMNE